MRNAAGVGAPDRVSGHHLQDECRTMVDVSIPAPPGGVSNSHSRRARDLSGQRFGRLVALHLCAERRALRRVWECRCDCGAITTVPAGALTKGNTKSCGCLHIETARLKNRTHGATCGIRGQSQFPRTYRIWLAMRRRCIDPKLPSWDDYGGRGIRVCDKWSDYTTFLLDMGECPPGYSIDRIDPNGNYEPGNVRWASASEQARNTRKTARMEINGVSMSVRDACDALGLNAESVKAIAYREGMSTEQIVREFLNGERKRRAKRS